MFYKDYIVLVQSLLARTIPFALFPSNPTTLELDHVIKTSKATHIFVHGDLFSQAADAFRKAGLPEDRIYVLEGSLPGQQTFGNVISYIRETGIKRLPV